MNKKKVCFFHGLTFNSLKLTCISSLFSNQMLTCSMGTTVRVAVATGGSTISNYSMIVFTGWDYGCLGNQATKLKQKNIYYRLQVGKDPLNLTYENLFLSDTNRFAFTFFLPRLSMSGGSGGRAHKETSSFSHTVEKSSFILSAQFNVCYFIRAHRSGVLRHLCRHGVQSGINIHINDVV